VQDSLDATTVRRWWLTGLDGLRRHQQEIDELNVYPIPDGDTGTNLVLTVAAADEALAVDADALASLGVTLRVVARGALLGARGNSGVILSQILRGLADALAAAPLAGGRALAAALAVAASAAYEAVARPVEGTILTVCRAAAGAATEADSDDLAVVVRAAADAARDALARTPQQLPVLARAGVVDAGGRGLCVLLDALVEVITGERPAELPARPASLRPPLTMAREAGSEEYAYEVQYLLDSVPPAVAELEAALAELGDSLVVVGGPATWNVHVHVNDVGAAVEAGVEAGRPYRITVTRFADQQAAPVPAASAAPDGHRWAEGPHDDGERAGERAVVAVASGYGLAELFTAEGAVVVGSGAAAPSTAEILDAIRASGARSVVVLPNDPNVVAVATAAAAEARQAGIRAGVVPTRSPVQALAALAVRDAGRRFDDDVIAMAEAAGACRYAEVTTASRDAITVAGRCQAGDVLGLVDGEVNLIGRDLDTTCRLLLDRLLAGGGELVTLVTGAGAPAGLADQLVAHLAEHWPFVEAQSYEGGQPHYPLLVGVE
jgi:DAK2 domain fusion protein YloV